MMETKEQKPWYHGVRFGCFKALEDSHFDHILTYEAGPRFGGALGYRSEKRNGNAFDHFEQNVAELLAAAPETATQRDSLLSVQKQLVEALEGAKGALSEATDKFHVLSFYIKDKAAQECCEAKVDEMSSANAVVRAAILAAKASS